MIKFAVVTIVCLLGLEMIAAMPVADHHEGHESLPVVPLEKDKIESLKAAEVAVGAAQSNAAAEPVVASQSAQPAAEQSASPAVRSSESVSEEAQPAEAKKDEPLPEQPKVESEEAQAQSKSSEEQLEEKEEPKVLPTAEAEKKQEQENLKGAASETKESVQPAPQEHPTFEHHLLIGIGGSGNSVILIYV